MNPSALNFKFELVPRQQKIDELRKLAAVWEKKGCLFTAKLARDCADAYERGRYRDTAA